MYVEFFFGKKNRIKTKLVQCHRLFISFNSTLVVSLLCIFALSLQYGSLKCEHKTLKEPYFALDNHFIFICNQLTKKTVKIIRTHQWHVIVQKFRVAERIQEAFDFFNKKNGRIKLKNTKGQPNHFICMSVHCNVYILKASIYHAPQNTFKYALRLAMNALKIP